MRAHEGFFFSSPFRFAHVPTKKMGYVAGSRQARRVCGRSDAYQPAVVCDGYVTMLRILARHTSLNGIQWGCNVRSTASPSSQLSLLCCVQRPPLGSLCPENIACSVSCGPLPDESRAKGWGGYKRNLSRPSHNSVVAVSVLTHIVPSST